MEILLIALLYGGGLLIATVFMVLATRASDSIIRILVCTALALGCLFAQRGCWEIASNIGRATGGGSTGDITMIPEFGIAVCVIWTAVLVRGYFLGRRSQPSSAGRERSPKAEQAAPSGADKSSS